MRSTLLAAFIALTVCGPIQPQDVQRTVEFDWFEYAGRDAWFDQSVGPDSFRNPILAGFYPDPSIVRADDAYYLVTSTFSWYPGVPVFRSTDLVNWTQIGYVLDRPSLLPVEGKGVSRGVFAPTIRYHDGVFYMITTLVDAGGNFFVTATDPADHLWAVRTRWGNGASSASQSRNSGSPPCSPISTTSITPQCSGPSPSR